MSIENFIRENLERRSVERFMSGLDKVYKSLGVEENFDEMIKFFVKENENSKENESD